MNGTTQRTSITEWINSMDQFQNKGVAVWSNPNTNGSTNSQTHGKGAGIEAMFPKYYPQLKEAFINTVNVDLIGTKGSGTETYRLASEKCGESAEWCVAGDGKNIRTLHWREGYYKKNTSGTSFVAPQVSAAIALVAQAFPTQTPAQWTARILASANKNLKKDSSANSNTGDDYSFEIIGYRNFGNVTSGYSDGATWYA